MGAHGSAALAKHQAKCDGIAKTAYMSQLLNLVAEKNRRLEDDFEIERALDGTEEIVGESVLKAKSRDPDRHGKEYAVKRVSVEKFTAADTQKAFAQALTEAHIAKYRCEHGNLARAHAVYYQVDTVDSRPTRTVYIVFDLIRPGSLTKVIAELVKKKRVFDERHIASIIQHVLKALVYIHDEGIMHRDVKTDNVVLDQEGRAILIDFGQSAIPGSRGSCVGTAGFRGEEAEGYLSEESQTPAMDIRPLGTIASELLAMREVPNYPYDVAHVKVPKWLDATLGIDKRDKPSADFTDFVVRCLQKKPAERPPPEELLEHRFIQQADQTSLKELISIIV